MVNGLPESIGKVTQADIEYARLNNQFVLQGVDPEFVSDNIIVFLEQVISSSYVIKDSAGTALTGTITSPLDLHGAPMRIDGGVIITGTVLTAKGYFIQK